MEGKTVGESVSEAGVKSLAVSAVTTLVIGSSTPIVTLIVGGVIISTIIDMAYNDNLFGIKDFTESIGNFIDNPAKVINELIENSEFKIENIKFVP